MKMKTNMNVSDAKVAANRENALKSTGPVSAAGKERTSRNAIKHGLLAKDVVVNSPLGGEDRAEFEALLAELVAEIRPRGFVERSLVERIATCYWRLHRVQRFENGTIREALETEGDEDDVLGEYEDELRDEEQKLASMDRLAEFFARPVETLTEADKQAVDDLVEEIEPSRAGARLGYRALVTPEDMRKRLPAKRTEKAREVERIRSRMAVEREQQNLERSRKGLVGSLPGDSSLLKVIRYETMLDRQIHRSLNQLRRNRERGRIEEDGADPQ